MKCNMCQAIMEVEAVVVDCGHTFCGNCFSKTMADSCPVCPHCDTPLGDDNCHLRQVMPNTAALRGVRPERAIAMFGEALTFWDNQRGLEDQMSERKHMKTVEAYKAREQQYKGRLKQYKDGLQDAKKEIQQATHLNEQLKEDNQELQARFAEVNKRAVRLEERLRLIEQGDRRGAPDHGAMIMREEMQQARHRQPQHQRIMGAHHEIHFSPSTTLDAPVGGGPQLMLASREAHRRGIISDGPLTLAPNTTTPAQKQRLLLTTEAYTPVRAARSSPGGRLQYAPGSAAHSGLSAGHVGYDNSPMAPRGNLRGTGSLNNGGNRFKSHAHTGGRSSSGGFGLARTTAQGVPTLRSPARAAPRRSIDVSYKAPRYS